MFFTRIDSPIQSLTLVSDGRSLTGLYMMPDNQAAVIRGDLSSVLRLPPSALQTWVEDDAVAPFPKAREQLAAYFAGTLIEFDLPLHMQGTAFQMQVWKALQTIPYGTTMAYSDLAQQIGHPNASRAVGMANGRNPISIIVPCHRIIGANGKLTGYGGGIERKQWLLSHERLICMKQPLT
jgi:methylated-DNA-[protein]-cysteine S-methyltransferase